MPQFTVDEDIAAQVERLAKVKPFENLSFNDALKRILQQLSKLKKGDDELELFAEPMALPKKASKKALSPSPEQWAASVPELKSKRGLTTWKVICDLLKIETGGDSARRRLKNWVKTNRTDWPQVPELSGD